jgi:hypothetical protein
MVSLVENYPVGQLLTLIISSLSASLVERWRLYGAALF